MQWKLGEMACVKGVKVANCRPIFLDLLRGEETECPTLRKKKLDRRCRVQ
jgi:hypothetical protein